MCALQKCNKNLVKYVTTCMSLYVCTCKFRGTYMKTWINMLKFVCHCMCTLKIGCPRNPDDDMIQRGR